MPENFFKMNFHSLWEYSHYSHRMGTSDETWSWSGARNPDRSNCKTSTEEQGLEGRERGWGWKWISYSKWAYRPSNPSKHMEKTIEQMVCLPPTHPSRFQQERKVGKVKMISSRICKLSYSVGKHTLKIVTWGRPVSLISSIRSLLSPQSAMLSRLSL